MSLAGLLSTFNTVLLIILASSRLLYGMGKEKSVPERFARTQNGQPLQAMAAAVIISGALLLLKDISLIAQMTDALLFVVFAVMNAVIIKLHHQKSKTSGFRVPWDIGNIPLPAVVGLLASVGMLIFVDRQALLYSFGFFVVLAIALTFLNPSKDRKPSRASA
jgi:APA family basic amino acid/polyamine antiporter